MSTASLAMPYRRLLAEPVLRRLAVADVLARLPQGMVSITVLLVAAERASMAVAGLAVAGYTLGQAVTGPPRGRLADRHGLVPVAAATAAGLVNPPLSPGLRSLWSVHAGAGLAQAAFALDTAVMNLGYVAGPVLAGVLATALAPAATVGLLLALTGAATVIVGSQPRRPGEQREAPPPRPRRPVPRAAVLGSAELRRVLLTAALANAALSATEIALTGYVRHHHALWASGPLLAEVSIGSIGGSLLLGLSCALAVAATARAASARGEARRAAGSFGRKERLRRRASRRSAC